jgi:hypothetical protein
MAISGYMSNQTRPGDDRPGRPRRSAAAFLAASGWLRPMFLFYLTGIIILACSDDDPTTAVPPIFSVTPVDMSGTYTPADSSLGDIRFVAPVIIPFGVMVDQENRSYGLQYITRPGAPVRAVTAGVIDSIITNPPPAGDYTVVVICTPGSDYTVYQDHILNLQVLAHTAVKPGDTLGEAGTWSDAYRRTAVRVAIGEGSGMRFHCPLDYGNVSFRDLHEALLSEYNRLGFSPAYDTLCTIGPVQPGY